MGLSDSCLKNQLESNGRGLLGFMRMAGAGINLQLGHLLTAQAGVRNHAFNSQFQKKFRAASTNLTGGVHLLTANVTGETGINFGIFLVTGQHHLVRVYDNDKIATINVRGENCLVLATQNASRFNGNTAEHLVGSVYNIPFALYFLRFG